MVVEITFLALTACSLSTNFPLVLPKSILLPTLPEPPKRGIPNLRGCPPGGHLLGFQGGRVRGAARQTAGDREAAAVPSFPVPNITTGNDYTFPLNWECQSMYIYIYVYMYVYIYGEHVYAHIGLYL